MLTIDNLTYRIQGRVLMDGASARIPAGWKVGLIGRNGTGKSTLLRLIRESLTESDSAIRIGKAAKMGWVAQEVEASDRTLIEETLAADTERAQLMHAAETVTDPDELADIHERLMTTDAWSGESRAASILTGLGFSQADLSRACREFSGGWRMRAALAGVLFAEPDLLLLDEPTNYLDLEGAAWLESYLRTYPHTVLLVSHDRELLNSAVTHILALEHQKLTVHAGNYDSWQKKKAEQLALAQAQKAKQDKQKAHLQSFVDRFRAKASKATQAQSRLKMLEKMQDIVIPLEERTHPFEFPAPGELASPLFVLDNADLGYAPGQPVLRNVQLRVDNDDRIAIVGANGQGKSTLVKSIANRLNLLAGNRVAAPKVEIGYFSQDQLDELNEGENALDHVRRMRPQASDGQIRAIVANIGFNRDKAETKVEKLSGGEKVRLLLGLTALKKPHILILDEPTSHLDIDSREALIHALNDYEGAVLLITHDVYLAEATADRLWLVNDGRAAPYDGDLSDYRALVLAADKTRGGAPAIVPDEPSAPPPPPKRSESDIRRATVDIRKQISAAEREMEKHRDTIAKLDAKLANPSLYDRDPDEAVRLGTARDKAQADLDKAEEAWLAASEAYETAASA
ncbi:ABC-F family ATP-binding cassette domain-containing protein [Henriciella pelagia]|jgi:ATP-binding cassette, subfamily F, member 3|uniref:Glycosyl transferase family 1 n=1 Tax=Henriciella pelagia TaxID=1977912 RepID=A0ABQ1JU73_9PROT|nr:ABC-F family ATP-binding cassette domain-containing protein [Henriciella pelagia]GGB74746.1 glycosyl transferase family 1 [Henriciella pelagia]